MQSDMFLDFGNDTQHLKPKTYTQYMPEEIMKSSIEYFGGDELAANVWMNKYALRDDNKIYELNPDMMHHRLASEFARIERNYPNPMVWHRQQLPGGVALQLLCHWQQRSQRLLRRHHED